MKKFLTLIAVAAMAFAAQAVELTVAEGTDQAQYAPIYGMYMDTRGTVSQVIYPADMLADMQGGTITAIKFYPTAALQDFGAAKLQVALKEVEQDRYTETLTVEGATVVAADLTPVTGATEFVIELAEPFVYSGGNLMIETTLTTAGNMKNTKFNGVSYSYAIGLAQYTYAWAETNYYETENVLPKATFTYTEGGAVEPGIATLAEANALEDAAEFTFGGDAVVTTQMGSYLFLRDESGYGMIEGVTGEFANGQVLSQGWNATKTSVNDGWVRYINAAGLSASGETNAELAAAQKLTGAVDESMLNAYVYIENVALGFFPPRSFTLPDGTTISKSEILGGINWSAGGNYNVYGIIVKDGGVLKINPVSSEPYVEPQPSFLRGDVNMDEAVSILDVTALIDYLLTQDATGISLQAADCNLDEAVSILDVTALIDYLLTGTW